MRDSIKELVERTIILKYTLPNGIIDKSALTTLEDYCLTAKDADISLVIYNSIIDYCLNDLEIDLLSLDENQMFAINNRLRYSDEDSLNTQMRYGFFGEVLLNIILKAFFYTKKIIAKGHFYNPTGKSELPGYDCFHFFEDKGIEFWFGEAKFYTDLKYAINKVLDNLGKALSVDYYQDNLRSILNRYNDLDDISIKEDFEKMYEKFKRNKFDINLLKKMKIKMVYPVLIVFNEKFVKYNENISKVIELIDNEYKFKIINNEINADILFIIFPVDNVTKIKKDVLKWISIQKSII